MLNKSTLAAFLCLMTIYSSSTLEGCTRIFWNNKVNKVSARSMDLFFDEKPRLAITPVGVAREGRAGEHSLKWTSQYGSVVVTALDGYAVTEGMNEKGLSAHLLFLRQTDYGTRDDRPGLSNTLWLQYVLDSYSSVEDVLAAIDNYQIISTKVLGRDWPMHACLEDKDGNSAIIEYVNGKIQVSKGPHYAIMTNDPTYHVHLENLPNYKYFGGEKSLPGDINSASRFVRSSAFLKSMPEPSQKHEAIARMFGLIRTMQIPFGAEDTSEGIVLDTWPTRWVTVMDLTNLTYYFDSTSCPNLVWVDLKNIDFKTKTLNQVIDPNDVCLVGDVSDKFKVMKPTQL